MNMTEHGGGHLRLPVNEASRIAEARRMASNCALRLGFDELQTGRVALVATEMATNLLKHARDGELLVRGLAEKCEASLELLAIDRGPGMEDFARSLRDGYSSAGSRGTGLGAIARGADEFDVDTRVGSGTVLLARIYAKPKDRVPDALGRYNLLFGAVCLPYEGEEECGDAWTVQRTGNIHTVIVADGVGHGPLAASAARDTLAAARANAHGSPAAILEAAHQALRRTRGAAVMAVEIDSARSVLRYAGVGNIAGMIMSATQNRHLLSHNGTLGHNVRVIQEVEETLAPEDVLILHSDGLGSRWVSANYPGLLGRHPAIIAGVLYRDLRRARDDVTVVVVKRGASV